MVVGPLHSKPEVEDHVDDQDRGSFLSGLNHPDDDAGQSMAILDQTLSYYCCTPVNFSIIIVEEGS